MMNLRSQIRNPKCAIFVLLAMMMCASAYAGEPVISPKTPIIVDGDTLEYSQAQKEVTATGNVIVTYKDSKLFCDKATVNMDTKDCVAEGRVRLIDAKGVVRAHTMMYNFNTKAGTLLVADFASEPIYGSSAKLERVNENKYEGSNTTVTTCSYDKPHYGITAKKVEFYPNDRVRVKHLILRVGKVPVFYFPVLSRSLKDSIMPLALDIGKSSDWGNYFLSAWRFNVSDSVKGRILIDYRNKLGPAGGFGLNYQNTPLGSGDFKFYYSHEHLKDKLPDGSKDFERSLIRWRHTWQMTDDDRLMFEINRIKDQRVGHEEDVNFMKDYFYREYERDPEPKTYFLLNHIFPDASFNFYVQKQTTKTFEQIERLPQASLSMPAYQLFTSPVYFRSFTTAENMQNANEPFAQTDEFISRFDTRNEFFMPLKAAFVHLNPYVGVRETLYSEDKDGESIGPRSAIYSGLDLSTKFFRTFGTSLRHVINPMVRYQYISDPTIGRWRLPGLDQTDDLEGTSRLRLELTNILQKKHKDGRVTNAALLRIFTDYNFERQEDVGKGFSDITVDFELNPMDRLRFESYTVYDMREDNLREADVDLAVRLGNEDFKDRSVGIGYHFENNGSKATTAQLIWRINPKWKFRAYERYQFSHSRDTGLEEQEYAITRDLHCWEFDLAYNISKDNGHTIWFIMRLKAFPGIEFDYDQNYNAPKTASE